MRNLSRSFADGVILSAIIHSLLSAQSSQLSSQTSCYDWPVEGRTAEEMLELAFSTASSSLGVDRLLDPEDVVMYPEERSIMLYLSMLRAVATTTTAAEKEKEVEVEVELEEELEVVVVSMPPPLPPPSFGRAMSISTNGHQLEQYLLELKESMRRSPGSVSGSVVGVSGGGVSGASGDSLGTSSSSGGGATRTLSNEFHQMRRRQSISNVDLTKFEDQEVEEWLVRIYFFIIIYFCFLHFELATNF